MPPIYISPRIQNEIVDIIGKCTIQKSILEEIRKAKLFSVMADEVTSHNKEIMPLCIRFVDEKNCIRGIHSLFHSCACFRREYSSADMQ